MKLIWDGSGYALCEARTGQRDVWPSSVNRTCPECDRDFVLDDYLWLVEEEEGGAPVAYHRLCAEEIMKE